MGESSLNRVKDRSDLYILHDRAIGEIVVTTHARSRWNDRVESEAAAASGKEISVYLWDKLKANAIRSYYRNEQDVYLVDEDLVMVAEFVPMEASLIESKQTLYRMIVITFLGRMSETMELRDLRSYYSWLRHSRRMTLIKNGRKRR